MLFENENPTINKEFISEYSDCRQYFNYLNTTFNNSEAEINSAIEDFSFLIKSINSWKNVKNVAKNNISRISLLFKKLYLKLSNFSTAEIESEFYSNFIEKTEKIYNVWIFPKNSGFLNGKCQINEEISESRFIILFINENITNEEIFEIGKIIEENNTQKIKIICDNIPKFIFFTIPTYNIYNKLEDFYAQLEK